MSFTDIYCLKGFHCCASLLQIKLARIILNMLLSIKLYNIPQYNCVFIFCRLDSFTALQHIHNLYCCFHIPVIPSIFIIFTLSPLFPQTPYCINPVQISCSEYIFVDHRYWKWQWIWMQSQWVQHVLLLIRCCLSD